MQRTLKVLEPVSLVAVFAVMVLCAIYGIENAALLTLAVVVAALLPFLLRFEIQKPRPRDIMPIVVLAAIAAVGRILFAPFPNFKPVSAIVIVTGIYFGRQNGFLCGAFAALVSNMFFGQGAWTPWQMYGWGLMGYLAGVLQDVGAFKKQFFIYIYGAAISFVFGMLLDSWFLIGFLGDVTPASVAATFFAGVPFDISHAVSTVVFLALVILPWGKKILRVKEKYGLASY